MTVGATATARDTLLNLNTTNTIKVYPILIVESILFRQMSKRVRFPLHSLRKKAGVSVLSSVFRPALAVQDIAYSLYASLQVCK